MKLITANKLNKLWQNGIVPNLLKKINKTNVLTTAEEVTANTNPENIVAAPVIGELYNKLMNLPDIQYGSAPIVISNAEKTLSVYFDKPFETVPVVVAIIRRNGYASSTFLDIARITNTYAEFAFLTINTQTNVNCEIQWIAIGK